MSTTFDDFQIISPEIMQKMSEAYYKALSNSEDALMLEVFLSLCFCLNVLTKLDKITQYGQSKIAIYKAKSIIKKELSRIYPEKPIQKFYFKVNKQNSAICIVCQELCTASQKCVKCNLLQKTQEEMLNAVKILLQSLC